VLTYHWRTMLFKFDITFQKVGSWDGKFRDTMSRIRKLNSDISIVLKACRYGYLVLRPRAEESIR
jgi:hypothetical protein